MQATLDTEEPDALYTLVTRTAARQRVNPRDLDPISEVIDPDLVTAFATSDALQSESELRFEYNGCEVCIDGTGEITIQASLEC